MGINQRQAHIDDLNRIFDIAIEEVRPLAGEREARGRVPE